MTNADKDLTDDITMSASDFAHLGDGEVAYIKEMNGDEARRLFPTVSGLPEGLNLYALVAADGTPLALADSRNGAIANAIQNDLEPMSVH